MSTQSSVQPNGSLSNPRFNAQCHCECHNRPKCCDCCDCHPHSDVPSAEPDSSHSTPADADSVTSMTANMSQPSEDGSQGNGNAGFVNVNGPNRSRQGGNQSTGSAARQETIDLSDYSPPPRPQTWGEGTLILDIKGLSGLRRGAYESENDDDKFEHPENHLIAEDGEDKALQQELRETGNEIIRFLTSPLESNREKQQQPAGQEPEIRPYQQQPKEEQQADNNLDDIPPTEEFVIFCKDSHSRYVDKETRERLSQDHSFVISCPACGFSTDEREAKEGKPGTIN